MNSIATNVLSSLIKESIKSLATTIAYQIDATDIIREKMKSQVDAIRDDLIKSLIDLDTDQIIIEVSQIALQESKYDIETKNETIRIMNEFSHLEPINVFQKFHSLDQQLEFLKMYDLNDEDQPEAILSWFDIKNPEDADKIASIYMKQLGPIAICHDATNDHESYHTILDCLIYESFGDDFISAFEQAGFKYADECDRRILANTYWSKNGTKNLIASYDYQEIKNSYQDLSKELQEYLFHPMRIQKWIDGGNDIEDYLD